MLGAFDTLSPIIRTAFFSLRNRSTNSLKGSWLWSVSREELKWPAMPEMRLNGASMFDGLSTRTIDVYHEAATLARSLVSSMTSRVGYAQRMIDRNQRPGRLHLFLPFAILGAAEEYGLTIADGMARRGWEVTVAHNRRVHPITNCAVIQMSPINTDSMSAIARWLAVERPALLHVNQVFLPVLGLARLMRIHPTVTTAHTPALATRLSTPWPGTPVIRKTRRRPLDRPLRTESPTHGEITRYSDWDDLCRFPRASRGTIPRAAERRRGKDPHGHRARIDPRWH